MTAVNFVRRALLLICLAGQFTSAFAQDATLRYPRRIPVGDEIIKYEKVSEIPLTFADTLKTINCNLSDRHLSKIPILFFRAHPKSRPILLVNCEQMGLSGRLFWFERGKLEEMSFAVLNLYDGGIGFQTTKHPGFLEWDTNSKTLIAIQSTDIFPSYIGRTTYKIDENGQATWSLIKMEIAEYDGVWADVKWKTYWEAMPWQLPPKRR